MRIHIRYVGAALEIWQAHGSRHTETPLHLDAAVIQRGDVVTHPDFPVHHLLVVARELNLREPALTLYLDLLPGDPPAADAGQPDNVVPLGRKPPGG